ncbi:MAG: rod shape-determining protein RodA [Cytophagales bacterium]|nr:rod shape-determining protein RodA [Cytophagales bacterium]
MSQKIDPWTLGIYFLLVLVGWALIYASEYTEELNKAIYDPSLKSGKQMLWIGLCLVLLLLSIFVHHRVYDYFAYLLYLFSIIGLISVLFWGVEVSGSRSWINLGVAYFQPSELAKYATCLALAKVISMPSFRFKMSSYLGLFLLMALPTVLIIAQGDVGTALVFPAFALMLYRGGMPSFILFLGIVFVVLFVLALWFSPLIIVTVIGSISLFLSVIWAKNKYRIFFVLICALASAGFVWSTDYVMTQILKPYQTQRIQSLFNPSADPLGMGWNVTQSKIAIGSGGLVGKGYLQGTQSRHDFVPEESTDFIFCTLGEEFGWVGTTCFLLLFSSFLLRLIYIAERQRNIFSLLYGYGVVCIFLAHYLINLSMTLGFFPVIGIPLPFLSYGGSSLVVFSLMVLSLLKMDMHRTDMVLRI